MSDLSERFLEFAVEIIKLVSELPRTITGRHIGKQLLSSSTSAGANYEEACGAQSRADFVHKLQIVLKELRESCYWLRLIAKSNLTSSPRLAHLIEEVTELSKIIGKSVVTAKKAK